MGKVVAFPGPNRATPEDRYDETVMISMLLKLDRITRADCADAFWRALPAYEAAVRGHPKEQWARDMVLNQVVPTMIAKLAELGREVVDG